MRRLILLVALALGACATTLEGQIYAGVQASSRYAERTTVLLQRDIITVADAEQRLSQIKAARDRLRAANLALAGCQAKQETSCTPAQAALGIAQAALDEVEIYLITKEQRK